jgi:hypothetical protein
MSEYDSESQVYKTRALSICATLAEKTVGVSRHLAMPGAFHVLNGTKHSALSALVIQAYS